MATNCQSTLSEIIRQTGTETLEEEGYRRMVNPADCVVIAHLHCLPSIVPLFKKLIAVGFKAAAIVIVPKPYSTVPATIDSLQSLGCSVSGFTISGLGLAGYHQAANRHLLDACEHAETIYRETAAKRFVLVDDGGLLTDVWWRLYGNLPGMEVVSVQQTASGMQRDRLGPAIRRIDVARCAAKKQFEANIIAAGVLRKITSLHLLNGFETIGVVGVGAVGSQLCRSLLKRGKTVFCYDLDPSKTVDGCERVNRWSECVARAGLIFGCTGYNFMSGAIADLSGVSRRYFVSLSSRDVEFKELLDHGNASGSDPFRMIAVERRRGGPFFILNGGFPINFDREREWETDAEISLTRGLVLLGILQTLYLRAEKPSRAFEKLALKSQKRLVELWLRRRGKTSDEYGVREEDFASNVWWSQNSGGSEYKGNWSAV